jgi:hypothetical protein
MRGGKVCEECSPHGTGKKWIDNLTGKSVGMWDGFICLRIGTMYKVMEVWVP